jgi:hypothetical protein
MVCYGITHFRPAAGLSGDTPAGNYFWLSESGLKKTALPALDSTRFLNGSDKAV